MNLSLTLTLENFVPASSLEFNIQPNPTDGIDTYIDETTPDVNIGTGVSMLLSNTTDSQRKILIKFDLTPLSGKTIIAATLSLWTANAMPNPGIFTAWRILSANGSWNEGGGTWNYAVSPMTAWAGLAGCSQSGIDFDANELGHLVTSGQGSNTELQFSLDPTEFTNLVNQNAGILITSNSNSISAFRTSDYATNPLFRPKLLVEYT